MDCSTPGEQIAAELLAVDLSPTLSALALPFTYTLTRDGEGGRTESWVAAALGIMVDVSQIRPGEPVRQGERKQDVVMEYKVTTGPSVNLATKDRLVITTGPSVGTYEVMGQMEKATLSFSNAYWCVLVSGF